ncbi:helix-turn-helix domain-containing protein [Streptomyces sp. NPDC060194]|uniref:helix-turn-helix domain-containing protein n=1 Tax=Streptomyces sp. NPDC060194 TaxID=3347069 RepID=UPI00364DC8C3
MGERPTPPDRILTAVLHELADSGYPGCTLRAVARRAGVDPRLIGHYFADKDLVRRLAMLRTCEEEHAARARSAAARHTGPGGGRPPTGRGGQGAALTAVLPRVWEAEWPAAPALLSAALTDDASAALLAGRLTRLVGGVLASAEAERSERGTAMAVSVLLGLALVSRAGAPATDPLSGAVTTGLGRYLDLLPWELRS